MTDIVERLIAYRPTNDWGDGVHHTICTEAAGEILSLRSREAERDMHKKASEKWYQSYQFKEATCEKLAAALEESRAAHLLLIAPQHIVGSSVIEALTKVTAAELSARQALSEYRKDASE